MDRSSVCVAVAAIYRLVVVTDCKIRSCIGFYIRIYVYIYYIYMCVCLGTHALCLLPINEQSNNVNGLWWESVEPFALCR